ncbi:uncharacterized protein N7506_006787 [Penicillium brevicompactum]|uniref:uncharacterized protein n=1 Tax=Penicillium brevicompactum TaxID=5074 RepID=UPI002540231C|nr:uncharacterized protein N7506_006787 [Penicillium brevicompactum]KAJ5333004.1 hypothetical protein N7506_006787 [Penicillium brevicompactum]
MLIGEKCDRLSPVCSRCERGRRDCVYPDMFDSAHRDQRVVAKASAETKWRQRVGNPSATQTQPDRDGKPNFDPLLGAPHVGLRDNLHDLAYQRFVYDFLTPSGFHSPAKGTFSRLDTLYSRAPPDSCLFCAVTAVSYANFYGRLKSEEARLASGVYYGKTLQKLTALMDTNPTGFTGDGILVVMLVLGLYETLASTRRDGTWITHMRGTQSIIASRDKSSNEGNGIVASLCLHLLVYYISERVSPPLYFHQWIAQVPPSFGNKATLSKYMAEVATRCAKLKEIDKMSGFLPQDSGLLDAALSLDAQLQTWASHMPESRSSTMLPVNPTEYPPWASELFSLPGAPKMTEAFSDPLAASDWNMYRATRIQLNLSLLASLDAFPQCADVFYATRLKSRVLDNIYTLSSEITSSVPHLLLSTREPTSSYPQSTEAIHGLRGWTVMWPVSIAFSCYRNGSIPDLDSQKEWLGTVLRFLRDSMGIGKAQAFLEAYG